MNSYTFQLEKFNISITRAVHNDTDVVTFSLKIGDQQVITQSKGMGDVNNGDHLVGLEFGPIFIGPATPVVVSFLIVNSGFPGSHEGDANSVLNKLSDASEKVANAVYPLGPVWPIVNKIIHELNSLFFVNCDGPVAGDRIPGPAADGSIPANILTGTNLDTLISKSGGVFRLTRLYHGEPSPVGCGRSSEYKVTWSMRSQVETRPFKIISAVSEKLLDVPGASVNDNVGIQQYHDNGGGANQQWRLVPLGNDLYNIVSVVSGKFLDVPGASVNDNVVIQQYHDNGGGANQQWRLVLI